MSLPDGVTTCLLTYGPITDTFGNPADSITVEVVADRTIVHAASGRTMFKNPVTATATGAGSVQIPVPHTNQSGFRDQQQNALTGWYYTVSLSARFANGAVQTDVKTFQPVTGQTEVDADLLQSPGMVTPGSVAQTTYVADPGGGTDGQVLKRQGSGYVLGDAGGSGLPKTFVSKTAAYSAAAGEFVLADTGSAGFTVTLPTSPGVGTLVAVKKVSADANTLTIAPAGGGSIDGDPTATTSTKGGGAVLEHVGSNAWTTSAVTLSTGPAGRDGVNGTNGVNGSQILSGAGAPSNSTGANGDYYVDTTNNRFFGPKAGGAWPGTFISLGGGLAPGQALGSITKASAYFAMPGVVANNLNPGVGELRVSPIFISRTCTLDRIGIQVTGAGNTGSTLRLGLYNDDGTGRPGTLVIDAGTVASDSTGRKELTISQAVAPGWYWTAIAGQTGTAGTVLVQSTASMPVLIGSLVGVTAGDTATGSLSGFATNGAETGTLPSTITTLTYNQPATPRVFLRSSN